MAQLAEQLSLVPERHRNNFLFSDYYLDNRVHQRPEWKAADAEARAKLEEIAQLWERFAPQGDKEAQTEYDWIRPVLEALGHSFNVQVSLRTSHGTRTPDYVFYPDEATRQAVKGGVVEEKDLRDALAVGDAKAWGRPLDQPIRVQEELAQPKISGNPSFQIDFYIRHTGLPWGILTNGRQWRLYHEDTSKKLDVYYEVDLVQLVDQATAPGATSPQTDAFKFFYLFFRQEAFTGDPAWLDLVLEESRAYEQGVSDNLKEQVYEALGVLAQGFLDFPDNKLSPTSGTLKTIHDNSLIILYRLLFTLYAEDRDLLPVRENAAYTRRYSLYALKQRIVDAMRRGEPAVASMDELWGSLRRLWRVLNAGNDDLGVPAYNGGLFDPEKHPFLERYRVGDLHLRQAIDLVARAVDPTTGRREFVDYRDLEIRHLGSIYEGLLEYQLRYAEKSLVVQRERGREVYVSADGAGDEPAVQAGQVYLVTDRGERKATGSYYTPDYIVQYIVEHTVGPVLDDVRARYTDENDNITDETALVQEILALNVLDPAMGSGHFLVAATDFIARYLVALGLETAEGLREGGELAYWRRRVVQACIYGVDVNPLAVELAKLSLWLNTVARDKPLSFLDHHLRPGNSLIGARVGDLLLDGVPKRTTYRERKEREQQEAGQLSMLDDSAFVGSMRTATGLMDQIEALESETVDDVQEAERIYRNVVRDTTRRYRTLADVWTARHFGLDVDDTVWAGLTQHVLREGFEVPQYADIIEEARAIAEERRFFHWELEFPEVFFDTHGRLLTDEAGFDAVVGNPPYLLLQPQNVEPSFLSYYRAFEVAQYKVDIYHLFIERGIRVLAHDRCLSYITPSPFLTNNFTVLLRDFILSKTQILELITIPDGVFREASVDNAVFVLKRKSDEAARLKHTVHFQTAEIEGEFLEMVSKSTFEQRRFLETPGHMFTERSDRDVWRRHEVNSIPLHELANVNFGMQLRDRREFPEDVVKTSSPQSLSSDYVPCLTGKDVSRYGLRWDNLYAYFNEEARRGGCWDQSVHFADEKLVIRQIGESPMAGYDDEQLACLNTVFMLTMLNAKYSIKFILSILNSRYMAAYWKATFYDYKETFPKIKGTYLLELPIRQIEFTTPLDTREKLVRAGQELYLGYIEGAPVGSVTGFIEEQLAHEPERADVVHDLLAFLAEEMIELHKERQDLEKALDPFKFLNRGVEFVKLPTAFADEVKYGELVREPVDLGAVHHDIDDLRLVPAGGGWELQVQLKLRDPDEEWQGWQYEEDGHNIAREWVPAYRFRMDAEKARYYQHAFGVLDQFTNAKSFPGGYTRTTLKKLQLTRVPAFDTEANLRPLVELARELTDVRGRIERTDELIDQVVYRLYGLTDEEIAVVEG